jgi:hypothetical protein
VSGGTDRVDVGDLAFSELLNGLTTPSTGLAKPSIARWNIVGRSLRPSKCSGKSCWRHCLAAIPPRLAASWPACRGSGRGRSPPRPADILNCGIVHRGRPSGRPFRLGSPGTRSDAEHEDKQADGHLRRSVGPLHVGLMSFLWVRPQPHGGEIGADAGHHVAGKSRGGPARPPWHA